MQAKRVRTALLAGSLAALCVVAFARAGAGGAGSRSRRQATATGGRALATLTIRTPNVDIKAKKKTTFAKGASGQVLQQGDTLRTDATAGLAEISYTDGSYTRLGPNTEFSITKLTEKQGVRQTQGHAHGRFHVEPRGQGRRDRVLRGQAPAVPPRPSKARSSRWSARGTAGTSCDFIDLFDPVIVTMNGTQVPTRLARRRSPSTRGSSASVQNLTREDLLANLWVQRQHLPRQRARSSPSLPTCRRRSRPRRRRRRAAAAAAAGAGGAQRSRRTAIVAAGAVPAQR